MIRRRVRIRHWALIVFGALIFAFPLTVGAAMPISCRGVTMAPGDICAKAGGQGVQTYEQRFNDRAHAAPVIMVTGALVVAFGGVLLISYRAPNSSARTRAGLRRKD